MKRGKEIFWLSLTLAILFLIMPSTSLAADDYINSGGVYNISDYGNDSTISINTTEPVTLQCDTATYTNLRIVCLVPGVDLTLQDVKLQNGDASAALSFTGPSNALTLHGSNVLNGGSPGVLVETGTALTIGGTGSLDVTADIFGAGIGSGMGKDYGDITITGGTITASSRNRGAGIGLGSDYDDAEGSNGKIVITGGAVIAHGGIYAAGIGGGGGSYGGTSNGTVIISGGTVTATGSNGAAGIGGGSGGDGGTIQITGGTVTATGDDGGAGIGGGHWEAAARLSSKAAAFVPRAASAGII